MKIKINYRSLFVGILIITPFIDIINATMQLANIHTPVSFGQAVRVFILGLMMFAIRKKRNVFLKIICLMVFLLIRNITYFVLYNAPLFPNLICDMRYLYVLVFGMLLFSGYRSNLINWECVYKTGKKCVAIFAFVTAATNIIDIGIDYAGTKRLFTEVNGLTAILVWGSAIWLYEILSTKICAKNVIVTLVMVYATFSQATKTGIIGVIVAFAYAIFYMGIIRKKYIKLILGIFGGVIGIIFIYRYFLQGAGIDVYERWIYFMERQDIVTFLLSGRNSLFETSFEVWKSNPIYIIFGISLSLGSRLLLFKDSTINYIGPEMDVFDIAFYYGLIIFIPIFLFLLKSVKASVKKVFNKTREGYFSFAFLVMFIISFLGGHVLSSPMAGLIACVSYFLTLTDYKGKMQTNLRGNCF